VGGPEKGSEGIASTSQPIGSTTNGVIAKVGDHASRQKLAQHCCGRNERHRGHRLQRPGTRRDSTALAPNPLTSPALSRRMLPKAPSAVCHARCLHENHTTAVRQSAAPGHSRLNAFVSLPLSKGGLRQRRCTALTLRHVYLTGGSQIGVSPRIHAERGLTRV
jgi:hypothetical protein